MLYMSRSQKCRLLHLAYQGKGCEKIPQDGYGIPKLKTNRGQTSNFDPTPYVSSFETRNNLSQAHKSCLYIKFAFSCKDMHLCVCICSDVRANEEPAKGQLGLTLMGFSNPAVGLRAVILKSKHTAGAMLGSLGQTPGHAREMVGSSVLGEILTLMGNCQLYGPIFGHPAKIPLRIYLGYPRKDHDFDSYLDA